MAIKTDLKQQEMKKINCYLDLGNFSQKYTSHAEVLSPFQIKLEICKASIFLLLLLLLNLGCYSIQLHIIITLNRGWGWDKIWKIHFQA